MNADMSMMPGPRTQFAVTGYTTGEPPRTTVRGAMVQIKDPDSGVEVTLHLEGYMFDALADACAEGKAIDDAARQFMLDKERARCERLLARDAAKAGG